MNEPYGHQRGTDIVSQLRWAMNRIHHMVRWSKISKEPDESKVISQIQIETFKDQEIHEDVNSMEHYGFHSVPDVLCDVVMINLAGNNHHPCIIASNDQRYRPKDMLTGEVQMYDNDEDPDKQQQVYLSEKKVIYIIANETVIIGGASHITLDAPVTRTTGTLSAGNGATGTFTDALGTVITVQSGIITNMF